MKDKLYIYPVKEVLRVIDGDTVDVIVDQGFDTYQRMRVRLYGIDAPETRTRDPKTKAHGMLSADWLRDILSEHSGDIILQSHEYNRDKYGRVLGTFHVGGVNVNNKMVIEHLAVRHSDDDSKMAWEHEQNRVILKESGML